MGKKIRIRRKNESMAYVGSLIQQNFGESIDKGYLLWNIESRSHVRKFIPNDFGFAKINIARMSGVIRNNATSDVLFAIWLVASRSWIVAVSRG